MIKRNHLYILLPFFVLFTSLGSFGQSLSKEEAIRLTLENNFDIQVAKNNLEISDNNQHILNSGYLPSLTGNAGASYDISNSKTIPNGTAEENAQTADVIINGAETTQYNAGLNLSYTIFDGLGRHYNFKKFKEQYHLTELQTKETIENTIFQLFNTYYEVARLTENVTVLDNTLKISQDREERSKVQFEYGQVNKLSILNAQVDVANDSINLLNEKQSLKTAKRNLNLLLREDIEKEFLVDTTIVFLSELKLQELSKLYKENNVTLLQNESNTALSKYDVNISKSGLLPSLGFLGSYGWNRAINPERALSPVTIFPSTIQNQTSLNVSLSLTWNLFDGGGTKTSIKNAKINHENNELLQKQIEQQIETAIANAKGNYNNLLSILGILKQNVVTSSNNFERSKEEYKLGRITSITFREAQLNLLNAKTNLNFAKYNAKVSELQLLQLLGQLLNVDF